MAQRGKDGCVTFMDEGLRICYLAMGEWESK